MIRSFLLLLFSLSVALSADGEVDFNRDIRPILSDRCFHCHGPDAKNQKSDLRLDTRENALADLDGVRGIVPGDLKASEVHWRIRLPKDDIDVMPPADSHRVLTKREKDLLDAWIEQGAEYDVHWSFKKPVKHPLPMLNPENQKRATNAVDHFVFHRLEEEGLQPTPDADLETRLRRAALTLTGLPPTPEQMESGLAEGYEPFVDRLLATTDYAERQTLRWLDAARYADTDGYQNDSERKNWPWRDWVIQAFHENMPFDRFTIKQLAGDMLPEATGEQILASAFNRNHRQNAEGGALAPEFFVENVIDRVETTSTVWLGLTMGCARCHDHKYDPLSQREFFQLFAYFNNIGERGTGKGIQANPVRDFRSPLVEIPTELATELENANAALKTARQTLDTRFDTWLTKTVESLDPAAEGMWKTASLSSVQVYGEATLEDQQDGSWKLTGPKLEKGVYNLQSPVKKGERITAISVEALSDPSFSKPRQLSRSVNGNFVLTDLKVLLAKGDELVQMKIGGASATYSQEGYPVANAVDEKKDTGWAIFGKGNNGASDETAYFVFASPIVPEEDTTLHIQLRHESGFASHNIGRLRIATTEVENPELRTGAGLDATIVEALRTPAAERTKEQVAELKTHHQEFDPELVAAEAAVKKAEAALGKIGAGKVPVMVMQEREGDREPAYLLERGQYDAPDRSEELPRRVPAAIFGDEEEKQPRDRLELARWIASDENPLTARVVVNRIWQDHFGTGLVKTTENFGAQSELPSHPELLDWLAVEFMESGWDVKALHKLIVTSATFQQSSAVVRSTEPGRTGKVEQGARPVGELPINDRKQGGRPVLRGSGGDLLNNDPENRLLARGPRYRLDGFAIRDLALQAAGLLGERVGGPPVKPYQPVGLWNSLAAGAGTKYVPDKGDDLYRKSVYTYWKRAVNPPRQLIFDSSGREACNVGVKRTNTPLQALVLMNDVTFVEAARNLAEKAIKEKESRDERLRQIYRRATSLTLKQKQLDVLGGSLDFYLKHFAENADEATEFLEAGMSPRDTSIPVAEHAAWTAVAHLVLNLDTTISVQ